LGVADSVAVPHGEDWQVQLKSWAEQRLTGGDRDLLGEALPILERTLIETALSRTHGHRQEAAKLLGWGRNTLTRKLKELHMDVGDEATG
jgi:two-component system nitrogen regulation response regulator GlnG